MRWQKRERTKQAKTDIRARTDKNTAKISTKAQNSNMEKERNERIKQAKTDIRTRREAETGQKMQNKKAERETTAIITNLGRKRRG